MIELFDGCRREEAGSSKGNQLKWLSEDTWYKADYAGYEGLSEYACSHLLRDYSTLAKEEVTEYETEQIKYKSRVLNGCRSRNMLPPGWQLITLERLLRQQTGRSIGADLYRLDSVRDRLVYLETAAARATGLDNFGEYLSKMITMDAVFLNEDRHTHNIAVLLSPDGKYHFCPFFDQGASLLSDTTLDYPLEEDTFQLMRTVKAKTVCQSFEEALEASESLYGIPFRFHYTYRDLQALFRENHGYEPAVPERMITILMEQRRKYGYLFV